MSAPIAISKRRLAKRTKRASGAVATTATTDDGPSVHDSFYVLFPQREAADTVQDEAAPAQEPFAFNDDDDDDNRSMDVDKAATNVAAAETGTDDALALVPPAASTTMTTPSVDAPPPPPTNDGAEHVDNTDAPIHDSVESALMSAEEASTESPDHTAVVPHATLPAVEMITSLVPSADDAMDQQQDSRSPNNKRPRQDDCSESDVSSDAHDTSTSTETIRDTAEHDHDDEPTVALPLKKRRRMLVPEDDSEANDNAAETVSTADGQRNTGDDGDRAELSDTAEESTVGEPRATNMDVYPSAVRQLGITRLATVIGYMTALVGGGHCQSFDVGTAGPSGRPALRTSRRLDCTDDGRRFVCGVDWHLYGSDSAIKCALPRESTVSGKGTAFDPYVATIRSAVATPAIVEPLYDDWAPSVFDQRLARPQDKIVLRFALTNRADRDKACAPLACLLDDGDATSAGLPPARQRVSVHMDAVWRRLAAHPPMFKAAAEYAEQYRSLVASSAAAAPRAVTTSSPASPLTAVSTPIAVSS
ncbi:hypothetical protein psal_cds_1257 [Pandoravirus salinus]|uniref:Uncharacterized protein n=1 Tax=Pandoravirus salinus TaxID=1349410 RepID=S4W4G0_9VIRU|nr:hypothetical protein psal_cds_1257 [Pandoravirus salinus]AGO85597.1 hypothetical protein psal_cds_1257 [Pandoravirus salinus]